MSKTYKQIIEDLEKAISDIESQGISIQPLNKALENLKTHSKNIEAIENNIDAVKSEVIDPIKIELEENKRAGKFSVWGFYIGIFGLIVTAISLLYTTFGTNSNNNLYRPQDSTQNLSVSERIRSIDSSVKELNYSIHGLNDNYKPLENELFIKQFEKKPFLSQDSNRLIIKAYIPEEIKSNNKWFPIVSLSFSINDKQIGIIGLKDKVSVINNSGVAKYDPNQNSINLSENDEFIILGKYRYIVQRIYRSKSQIMTVCDKAEAVLLRLVDSRTKSSVQKDVVINHGNVIHVSRNHK